MALPPCYPGLGSFWACSTTTSVVACTQKAKSDGGPGERPARTGARKDLGGKRRREALVQGLHLAGVEQLRQHHGEVPLQGCGKAAQACPVGLGDGLTGKVPEH